jgi:hypothetical protein
MLPAFPVEAPVSNLLDQPLARHEDAIIRVELTHAARGGWEVIATFEEYVLERHHYDDWHRAERAYLRMKTEATLNRDDEFSRETIKALLTV